ncbi:MAG TPA: hypothetical protein VN520_36900 [Streptomyces sp.]|uniref:hypothetical protein n=1 Tax=Streptomyces sp. TaxID=1931 RepID=UPI002BBC93BF|nr:hypothetical protein [Streptomyces sp.]HWU11869.1 hypothetical protein [Streptomyces sp.]
MPAENAGTTENTEQAEQAEDTGTTGAPATTLDPHYGDEDATARPWRPALDGGGRAAGPRGAGTAFGFAKGDPYGRTRRRFA